MKKLQIICLLLLLNSAALWAQQYTVSGTITDATNQEPLIGATISVGATGTATDFDGTYKILLDKGPHQMMISYLGYKAQEISIDVNGDQTFNIELESDLILTEVVVTEDIAIERETPIAFSNVTTKQLQEELAAQDIPMILNSTPGVYATETGGGDGDARITIRGFDQRNIAVMLDGIPVNDMENGWVYWSNWFGLDLVTQTMQVQRGLGASKLSVPSVGGTVNILTKGIDAKRSFKFKQEIGNNGFLRSTIGLTTGRLKSGWGISAAASYKQGDGWVDGNFTKGYFYYLRVDKQLGNHIVSFSGFGAPQEHGQRSFTTEIGQVDTEFAEEQGIPRETNELLLIRDKGRKFNQHWGYRDGQLVNSRKNYYHKPQFNLRHSWQASDELYWSNIAYLSLGNGGGTADDGGLDIPEDENNQLDFDRAIELNQPNDFLNPLGKSNAILRASVNNHFWYGLLSTVKYELSPMLTLSGGIDARYYQGDHYREVYDLLGGTGFVAPEGDNLQVGDRYDWDYSGFVQQLGGFGLLEYKQEKWSSFINASYASIGYKFRNNFTDFEIDWVPVSTNTIKGGANYNINRQNSIFFNVGLLNRSQPYRNVIITNVWTTANDGQVAQDYDNQKVRAIELGYSFGSPMFSVNVNGYYTNWGNKPLDRLPSVPEEPGSDERVPVNITGIDALHKGIEIDFAFKPNSKLSIEGLASIGDWTWNSSETALVALPTYVYEFEFDAKGVHIGDAAQYQFGGMIRYAPIKGAYVKLKAVHFAKNYAAFNPEDLQGDNGGRDSWQLPNYTLFSFHAGYSFKIKKMNCNLRLNVINLLDEFYISDARNNDNFNTPFYEDFDAKSASVHFGQGRRGTVSFQISF